jgi:hypothetical protein
LDASIIDDDLATVALPDAILVKAGRANSTDHEHTDRQSTKKARCARVVSKLEATATGDVRRRAVADFQGCARELSQRLSQQIENISRILEIRRKSAIRETCNPPSNQIF